MESEYFELQSSGNCLKERNLQDLENLGDSETARMKKDDALSEFGMFSVCESLIADSNKQKISNKDSVYVDDLNSVSNSDLLFNLNPECYENILSDSNLLNPVLDNVNFYNETSATLYSNDTDKQIFDSDVTQPSSDNFDHLITDISATAFRYDTVVEDADIASKTENLENIVPNWNCYSNIDLNYNINIASENIEYETLVQSIHKSDKDLLDNKDIESYVNKTLNNSRINSVSHDKINDLLSLKQPFLIANNNNSIDKHDVSNLVYNKCSNDSFNVPKKYLTTVSVRNPTITSSNSSCLLSDQTNSTVPVKRMKDANGLPAVTLYLKKSQMNELKNKSLRSKYHPNAVTRYKQVVSKITKEQVELPETTVARTVKADKSVQTCDRNNDLDDKTISKRVDGKGKTEDLITLTDKIKKPEPFNTKLLFTFSVNIRKLTVGTLDFDEFHKDNERIKYYTGIPKYSYFMALLNCLNLPKNNIVSPFQMLLLTLMKLRLNLDWMDLAFRFGKNVEVAKDMFGITLYILNKCLSSLIRWPVKENGSENSGTRRCTTFYVYSVKLNLGDQCSKGELRRIFICLSSCGHPIHFVSKPVSEEQCTNGLDILDLSGIMEKLVLRDVIIFDKEIDYLSTDGVRSVLSVLSKSHSSFCSQPYVDSQNKLLKLEETVNKIQEYKFLYDKIMCSWMDERSCEFTMFSNVVNVVCGIINLCSILPFNNMSIKSIIEERKAMNVLIT